MGWRGRQEGGSGWGTRVNTWLIHVNIWQKPLQYYKVISLQLINEKKKRKWAHLASLLVCAACGHRLAHFLLLCWVPTTWRHISHIGKQGRWDEAALSWVSQGLGHNWLPSAVLPGQRTKLSGTEELLITILQPSSQEKGSASEQLTGMRAFTLDQKPCLRTTLPTSSVWATETGCSRDNEASSWGSTSHNVHTSPLGSCPMAD